MPDQEKSWDSERHLRPFTYICKRSRILKLNLPMTFASVDWDDFMLTKDGGKEFYDKLLNN